MTFYNRFLLLITFAFLSCASSKNRSGTAQDQDQAMYRQLAEEKYQGKIKYKPNPDGFYMLCINDTKGTAQKPQNQLQFFIYDLKNEKLTFELKVGSGYVKWLGNKHVEVFRTPGVMRKDQSRDDFTTVYDVISGKGIPKKEFLDKN